MRSNSDLWCMIGGSFLLLFFMCWFVYDQDIVSNMGLVIPLVSFIAGYMLHQSLDEMAIRSLNKIE
jgi:hypothetical protein